MSATATTTSAPLTPAALDACVKELREQLDTLAAPDADLALAAAEHDRAASDALRNRRRQCEALRQQIAEKLEAKPALLKRTHDAAVREHQAKAATKIAAIEPFADVVQATAHRLKTSAGVPAKRDLLKFERDCRRYVALCGNALRLTGDRRFAVQDPWKAVHRAWQLEARDREQLFSFCEEVRRTAPRLPDDPLMDDILELVADKSRIEKGETV